MRARALFWRGGREAVLAAREMLEAVVREADDPCPALCLLALTHVEEGRGGWGEPPRDALFRGREVALRALRRAPGAPWPRHVLGLAAALMGDPDAARMHQLRALEIAPGFPPALGEMARLMALAGDVAEADSWSARALAAAGADPLAPLWRRAPALARFARGLAAEAAPLAEAAAAARPDWPQAALLHAACLLEAGRAEAADAALAPHAEALRAAAPEALRLAHRFADPARTEALLAPLARLA